MSRELKRVPLDFDWPSGIIWKGYLSPYRSIDCKLCEGSGYNPKTKKLSDDWYTHLRTDGADGWSKHLEQEDVQALIDANRLWDFTRIPRTPEQKEIVKKRVKEGHNNWLPFNNGYIPTAKEVNEWSKRGMGHDSSNRWTCVKAKAKKLGFWGHCRLCKGKGEYWADDKYEKLAEEWKLIEPPIGEAYQLWETTSEGSPDSPVFKSLDELCKWAEKHATTFASFKATADEWKKMLLDNFVTHKEGNIIFM